MIRKKMEEYTQKFLTEFLMQTCDAINNLGKGKAHLIDFNPRTKKYEIVTNSLTEEEKNKFKVNETFKKFDQALFEVEKIVRDIRELVRNKSCE